MFTFHKRIRCTAFAHFWGGCAGGRRKEGREGGTERGRKEGRKEQRERRRERGTEGRNLNVKLKFGSLVKVISIVYLYATILFKRFFSSAVLPYSGEKKKRETKNNNNISGSFELK